MSSAAAGVDDISIDGDVLIVLVNDEGQHSLWPAAKPVPAGWRATGPRGSREACLAYVDETWPDITPLSTRRRLRG